MKHEHAKPHPWALWHSYFGWAAYYPGEITSLPAGAPAAGFMLMHRISCGCMSWHPVCNAERPPQGNAYYQVRPVDPT